MEEWEGRALGSHPANLGSSGAEGVDPDEGGDIPASASCRGALGCCWIPAGSLTHAGVAKGHPVGRGGFGDKRTFPGGHTTCRLSESWNPGANL